MVLNVSKWEERMWNVAIVLCIIGIVALIIGGILHMWNAPDKIVYNPPEATDKNVITVNLNPGEKLVTANWERDNNHANLYVLTRPMKSDESPEVYTYRHVTSSMSMMYEIHEIRAEDCVQEVSP